jgi:predicted flap endonuclease-1-like 5' DNA nuclease
MTKLTSIEGIGAAYAEKLTGDGIDTMEKLLAAGATAAGRKKIAAGCEISEKLILKWVNRADLARVKGIGEEYADLLELSGVDTVPELAQRNAENLHAKMAEVNAEKNATRQLPSVEKVRDWVAQAKDLPRVVTH